MGMVYFYIACGGAIGATARFAVSDILGRSMYAASLFPFPTFIVNGLGCFLAGIVSVYLQEKATVAPAFILYFLKIGVLGSFTTFSTFSGEILHLWEKGYIGLAIVYAMISMVLCISAFLIGEYSFRG